MSHPKRGKCVTLLTGDGIRHRYELCGLLEGAAAVNVVLNLPKGPWEELEALLDRMKQGVLSGTPFEDHAHSARPSMKRSSKGPATPCSSPLPAVPAG